MSGRGFLFKFSVILLTLFVGGCGGNAPSTTTPPPTGSPAAISLAPFVSGFSSPLDFEISDDNSGRAFIVQQPGTIRLVSGGSLLPTAFLDITGKVNFDGGEQGLLGLAFHPNYNQNQHFYVNYDRLSGGQTQTVIAEYMASADPNFADAASERILLTTVAGV